MSDSTKDRMIEELHAAVMKAMQEGHLRGMSAQTTAPQVTIYHLGGGKVTYETFEQAHAHLCPATPPTRGNA